MWLPQQIQNLFLLELVRNLLTIFLTVYRMESRQLSNLQIITPVLLLQLQPELMPPAQ